MASARVENLLISFFDFTDFTRRAREKSDLEVFSELDEFYQISEKHIHSAGGKIIKFMGDAGLAVFPENLAEKGILSLLVMKEELDAWLKNVGWNRSTLQINCHFGEVAIGEIGGPENRHVDVLGSTVNICATLGNKDFNLSPQAFRCLSPESRKRFKKYTPPITYTLSS